MLQLDLTLLLFLMWSSVYTFVNCKGVVKPQKIDDPVNGSCTVRDVHLIAYANHVLNGDEAPLTPVERRVQRNADRVVMENSDDGGEVLYEHLSGPLECQNSTNNVSAPLNYRSVCGWKWEYTVDNMRLPRKLVHIKCVCPTHPLETGFECKTLYTGVKVIRFRSGCSGFDEVIEKLPMGCITVYPTSSYGESKPSVEVISSPTIPN